MANDQDKRIQGDSSENFEKELADAVNKMTSDESQRKDTPDAEKGKKRTFRKESDKVSRDKPAKSARPTGGTMKQLQLDDFDFSSDKSVQEKKESKKAASKKQQAGESKKERLGLEETQAEQTERKQPESKEIQVEEIKARSIKLEEQEPQEQGANEQEAPNVQELYGKSSEEPNFDFSSISTELPVEAPVKKSKGLKIAGIVVAMLVVAAGGAYAGASYYYTDKFFQGTLINGVDCSGQTAAEVEQKIAEKVENYKLTVRSRNQEPEIITGNEINYQYISSGDILALLQKQKPYEWVMGYFHKTAYTAEENITFDRSLLEAKLNSLNCSKEENQVPPQNAYIAYGASEFEIVPETQGSNLLTTKAYQIAEKAIANNQEEIDFEKEGAYETASITQNDPKLLQALQAYNQYSKASITYVIGDKREVLDGTTIKDWLSTSPDGMLVKDNEAFKQHIKDYVASLGAKYDTVGTPRTFTATNGRTVSVYGYAYGWSIDEPAEIEKLTEEINNGEVVEREPIYAMTANSHDDSDVGNTYIEVDMGLQYMYYYIDGALVFESAFISGKPDGVHNTPEGIYLLYNKESPSILRGEVRSDGTREYETPVSYWMAFNGGIGFHDATWQYWGFGGNLYQTLGSHGCINLPLDAAAQLYSIIRYGDPIVCFY